MSKALNDVIAERQRQVSVEGWAPEYDDQYVNGELAKAAGCYAMLSDLHPSPEEWPWAEEWWKPTTARRDLVKAGALILAEIERLDRVAGVPAELHLKPTGEFSVTSQQYRAEVTSYETQTRQVEHSSIDLTAEQYKALAQEMAPKSNHPEFPDSWAACQAISDLPEVDAALRELVEDSTGDNGVRVVQAVLRATMSENAVNEQMKCRQ
ncbi:hypothetical protein C3408_22625 [Candidatus Pantoea alvi]|nr:hypothetical protein C3408_22625 [Pantoea alvi]